MMQSSGLNDESPSNLQDTLSAHPRDTDWFTITASIFIGIGAIGILYFLMDFGMSLLLRLLSHE